MAMAGDYPLATRLAAWLRLGPASSLRIACFCLIISLCPHSASVAPMLASRAHTIEVRLNSDTIHSVISNDALWERYGSTDA